ncbi:MAG: hypothetical protein ACP5D7_20095, partial [Limnospira sp.]
NGKTPKMARRKTAEKIFDAQWIERELISVIGDRQKIKFSEAVRYVESQISYFDLLELISKSSKLGIEGTGKSKLLTLTVSEPEKADGTFWLPIDAIAESPDFQPRGWDWQESDRGIDQEVVEQYTEWLEFSESPPLEVWQGEIGGKESYWLIAGHHRIRALKARSRDRARCFTKARTYEEAVYRAAISNAGGGDRTRQIFKMSSHEWAEACRSFLRVCDNLPADTITDFLAQAKSLTGNSKTWSKLNDSAIAAVFGVSRASVANYRRQADFQNALSEKGFSVGDRVEFPADRLPNLDRSHRLGEIVGIRSFEMLIRWDSVRRRMAIGRKIENGDVARSLKVVSDPKKPEFTFKFEEPGAVLYHWEFGKCVVVAVVDDEGPWETKYRINPRKPLIMFLEGTQRGRHEQADMYDNGDVAFDVTGESLHLSIENRIEALRTRSDDASQKQADYLEQKYQPERAEPASEPAAPEPAAPASVAEETANTRERLLGTRSPQGEDGAELPDFPPNDSEPPDEGPPVADRDQVMAASIGKAIVHLGVNISLASDDQLLTLKNILEAELILRKKM